MCGSRKVKEPHIQNLATSYANLLKDNEPEVRAAAAYKLGDVSFVLGEPAFMAHFLGKVLCTMSFPSH
mgnify:CR=1 FL=1